MKDIKLIIVLLCVATLNSCALLFNGTKDRVTVRSMTPKSRIYIDGDFVGNDLASVKLKRKFDHVIVVKKNQCLSQTVHIQSETQGGWVVFDILFNWPGLIVDAATGAWKGFNKTRVTVDLDCKEETI